MAVSQSSEALRRPLYIMWVAFPVLALLSLVFGYLGFEQFLMSNNITEYGRDPVDLAYYDLQLFVLGADPLQSGQPRPLLLQIARFTAPAVTVYAAAEAIRLLLAVEL